MAFINKMDILGANFYNAVEQIKTRLGKNAIVLQLPIGKEDDFKGIIDLMEMEAYIYNDDKGDDITVCEIPDDMKEDAELYHTELVEKICELDDELMMMYLEDEMCIRDSPYTQALLSAIPEADPNKAKANQRIPIKGEIPSPINPKTVSYTHLDVYKRQTGGKAFRFQETVK